MAAPSLFFSSSPISVAKFAPRSPIRHPVRCAAAVSYATFDLRDYWKSLVADIEVELDAALPLVYPERIHAAMRHSVLSGVGAKRAPAVMCVAACELVAGTRAPAFPVAAALEMCHAASLVHDDLPCFDAATVRRGRPATHALHGEDIAILAGDALFPLAFTHAVRRTPAELVPAATLLRVLTEIARAVGAGGMAAGQFLDLNGATAGEVDVLLVLEKKFGEMAECSAACGAMLGGAGQEDEGALRRYGRTVGVLYELTDDVLMASSNGKMWSNASAVRALGMDRALAVVAELEAKAKNELQRFGDKYGDRVVPLYKFLDYALHRGFTLDAKLVAETQDEAR